MARTVTAFLTKQTYLDARTLWDYHQLGHTLRPTSAGIVLGCQDSYVAGLAARLYREGAFPLVVFTGANAPTTESMFPDGEAVGFSVLAQQLGVPKRAILVEPAAQHTAQNITFSRDALRRAGVSVESVTLVSRPSQQRRAYATCRRHWPDVDVVCAPHPAEFDRHVVSELVAHRVVTMLVGDTQRIAVYADRGDAIPQPLPPDVLAAYWRLVDAGYTQRLIRGAGLSPECRRGSRRMRRLSPGVIPAKGVRG